MLPSFRLGRLFGFPIEIGAGFLGLLAIVFLFTGGLAGVAIVVLAFASILVHELGHALVARHLDVTVDRIDLGFFGGAARMVELPRRPADEIAIAAAGPIVSFVLAGLAMALHAVTGFGLFAAIGWINVAIGAFNLLPALPMDGGRILRAALARRMSFARATDTAVTVARWVAGGLAVFALIQGSLYLVVLAGLLWLMGSRERVAAAFSGYRDAADVEVLPRGYRPATPRGFAGFTIRRHGRGFVIEPTE